MVPPIGAIPKRRLMVLTILVQVVSAIFFRIFVGEMTKVIETRLVPAGNIIAITLFGVVFTRDRRRVDRRVLNHERIHCAQQLEWLYLPFFVLYGAEYLWLRVRRRLGHDAAYRAISFEREAYDNDADFDYLSRRRRFANYRK